MSPKRKFTKQLMRRLGEAKNDDREDAAWSDLRGVLDANLPLAQAKWATMALAALEEAGIDATGLLVLLLRELQSHRETAAAAATWSQKWHACPAVARLGMFIPQEVATSAIAQRAVMLRELGDMLGMPEARLSTKTLFNALGTRLGLVRGPDLRWTTVTLPDELT